MTTVLSIDRFEGPHGEVAVLVLDDGRSLDLPRSLLPRDARAGDVVTLTLERDPAATARVAKETRRVQADLSRGDNGGDIKL